MSDDRIISVGKWWEWPASMWGSRDRAEAAQLGIGQQELGTTPTSSARTQPPPLAIKWLYEKPSTRQERRSAHVDELLAKVRGRAIDRVSGTPSVRSVRLKCSWGSLRALPRDDPHFFIPPPRCSWKNEDGS